MIDPAYLDELKATADTSAVADALGLQPLGKRRRWCPACQADGAEHRTPDLATYDSGFKCHRCEQSGDVIALVRIAEALDFVGAVAWLEDHTGIYRNDRGPNKHTRKPGRTLQPAPAPPTTPRPLVASAPPEFFEAFLEECRPVEGTPLAWLESKAITSAVVESMGLRFCGREYPDIIAELRERFSSDLLAASGLEKLNYYHRRRVGLVVFPYRYHGRVVCLKTRPPMSKTKTEQRRLCRFMAAGAIPIPYNIDILKRQPGSRVHLCEGETDTLAALSHGLVAVGVPGANGFKRQWGSLLRGRRVVLAFDGDQRGQSSTLSIADLLEADGQSRPRRLVIPEGLDLCDVLNPKVIAAKAESLSADFTEDFEERAAISEFLGDLPRVTAERLAYCCVTRVSGSAG